MGTGGGVFGMTWENILARAAERRDKLVNSMEDVENQFSLTTGKYRYLDGIRELEFTTLIKPFLDEVHAYTVAKILAGEDAEDTALLLYMLVEYSEPGIHLSAYIPPEVTIEGKYMTGSVKG